MRSEGEQIWLEWWDGVKSYIITYKKKAMG